MKKKIIVLSLMLIAFTAKLVAQENEETSKAKKEEKVIIKKLGKGKKMEKTTVIVDEDKVTVNGEEVQKLSDDDRKTRKQKRVTVMVDGDNVTINGKPVDKMTDDDIRVLRGNADHLRTIAPFIHGKINGDFGNGSSIDGNFNMPMEDFDMMIDDKKMNKALLGVTTEKNEKGAVITGVSKESAAEKAGLQKGDIITKINEDKIENSDDLIQAIGKNKPQDKVVVTYIRDGKTKNAEAILGKNNMQIERVFKWNDMDNMAEEIAPMMPERLNRKMFLRNTKPRMGLKIQDVDDGNGVKVLEVEDNTPAAKAGLLKDDIITEINGDIIKSVDDLKEKTSNVKEGDIYKMKYSRRGNIENVELKFPKKLKTADL